MNYESLELLTIFIHSFQGITEENWKFSGIFTFAKGFESRENKRESKNFQKIPLKTVKRVNRQFLFDFQLPFKGTSPFWWIN